jgi:uncharacterized protein
MPADRSPNGSRRWTSCGARALRDDPGPFPSEARLEVTGLEDLIGWGVWILVEQKAWGTFAFLFGVGFAVLLRRLEARGAPVVPTYLRRLAGLAAFGVIAEVFLGFHILFQYACWGLALLLIRRWSTRTLLVAAAVAACARPVAAELTALYWWWTGAQPVAAGTAELYRVVESAASGSDYGALVSARWHCSWAPVCRTAGATCCPT